MASNGMEERRETEASTSPCPPLVSSSAAGAPQRLPANPIHDLGVARHVVPVLGELKIVEPLGNIVRQDRAFSAFSRPAPVALARLLAKHGCLQSVVSPIARCRTDTSWINWIGAIYCTWVVRDTDVAALPEP